MFSCFQDAHLLYVIVFRVNTVVSPLSVKVLWSASWPLIRPRTIVASGWLSLLVVKRWPLVVGSTPGPEILGPWALVIRGHVARRSFVMLVGRPRLVILSWRSWHGFTGIEIPVASSRHKPTPFIRLWIVCLLSLFSWWCVARKLKLMIKKFHLHW